MSRLAAIASVRAQEAAPLSRLTRFQIGGPAALLCEAGESRGFEEALRLTRELALRSTVFGGGTNLVVSDAGYDGVVLRYTGSAIREGVLRLEVDAGATLQDVVDRSIELGLKGLETMTGIPGGLGGAVYGNAGAYGHSLQEIVESVELTDGTRIFRIKNEECEFGYRESIFKKRKQWVILAATLRFATADRQMLRQTAREIRTIRDAKYPPTMKCAGSIFKNVFFAELPAAAQQQVPPALVRDGKVPSAWFLEQVDVKGMRRGDMQVAAYHANLIYNDGEGTAVDLVVLIGELKQRVRARFGFDLEEEVQYVGFETSESYLLDNSRDWTATLP